MNRKRTTIRLTAALAVSAVAVLGIGSSAAAKPKPSPGCTAQLARLGDSGESSLQLYRWTLCGRGVGPAFG